MTGAIAFMDAHDLLIYDTPTIERNSTHRVDCAELIRILKLWPVSHAFVEQVNAFGMGATSAYNFGYGCGVVECALYGAGLTPDKITFVLPQKWKKTMCCTRDKEQTRARASELMPQYAHNWPKKRFHNRAEAALISLYGLQKCGI